MSCFCKQSLPALAQQMRMEIPPGLAQSVERSRMAQNLMALEPHLANGTPGVPSEAPQTMAPALGVPAHQLAQMATLARIMQQALNQCGIDLTQPLGRTALNRLIQTMAARMADPARPTLPNLAPVERLAALNRVASQVPALAQNPAVMPGTGERVPFYQVQTPAAWQEQVQRLQALHLAQETAQAMQAPLHDVPRLVEALQRMSQAMRPVLAALPPVPPETMSALGGMMQPLSAVSQLRRALGVDPLRTPYETLHQMVGERVNQALPLLQRAGVNLQQETPPVLPTVPGLPRFATPALQRLAQSMNPRMAAAVEQALRQAVAEAMPGQGAQGAAPGTTAPGTVAPGVHGMAGAMMVTSAMGHMNEAAGIQPAARPCSGCDARAITG